MEEKHFPPKKNLPQMSVVFLEFVFMKVGEKKKSFCLWIIFILHNLPGLVSNEQAL